MNAVSEINLALHPAQTACFTSPATEIMYGGAAGGGKSHLMRAAATTWCAEIPGLQVYLFRRVYEDLTKNHLEGPAGFRNMLAPWINSKLCRIVDDKEIRFWNGSRIYLCHCKDDRSIYKYQGAEIHLLLVDEGTHFTEAMYRFLRNRLRMVSVAVPDKYRGLFPRIIVGANPGNIGHLWVKNTWVDGAQPRAIRRMPEEEGGLLRQYIPARVEDNPTLLRDDPGYLARLMGLGSKELVRAMRFGDWDVVEGAFFDNWDRKRHVLRPFAIPQDWPRFRSGDWGSARPFSIGWWAVVPDAYRASNETGGAVILPRGAILRYREWYGMIPGKPNVGLKMSAERIGARLLEIQTQARENCPMGVLDPAAFDASGGPSYAERMMTAAGGKVGWRPADNSRTSETGHLSGWDALRARLEGDDDGNPMIACLSTCLDSIRTIPALQHDTSRPEDVDTDGEDHAGDEWRYACLSRPWVPARLKKPADNDAWARARAKQRAIGADNWRMT